MDVDCRRPRHDENYSSLFVENSHPETLHRDMCIACSGSSWILPMYLTNFPFTLMERKGISIFDNTDHGLAGIEDDLVPVVIVISGGTVIGSLLPIHM